MRPRRKKNAAPPTPHKVNQLYYLFFYIIYFGIYLEVLVMKLTLKTSLFLLFSMCKKATSSFRFSAFTKSCSTSMVASPVCLATLLISYNF